MKRVSMLFLAICGIFIDLQGQFIREYYKSAANATSFHAVVPISDSPTTNLYVVGNYGTQLELSEIKQNGTVIWSRRLMVNDADYRVNAMFVDSDGNIVMTGGQSIGVDDDAYGFVAKFDPVVKNLLWFRQVSTTVWFYDITEGAPGGNYYASGQEEDLGTGNQADLVVYSINRGTGAMSMITNLNKNINETGECIIYEPVSAGLYVAGRCELASGSSKFRICITKLDTLGTVEFSNYYVKSTASTARMYGRDMVLDDTTIVLVGFGDDAGTSTFKNLYLLKVDLEGNILTTKEYDITTTSSDGVMASVKVHDDGYLLYGHGYTVADEDVFLFNVDKSGEVNWAYTYPYKRSVNPSGFHFVSSLAIVGPYAFHVGQRTMIDGTVRGIMMRVPVSTGDAGTCEIPLSYSATSLTNFQGTSGLVNCTFTADFVSNSVLVKNMSLNTITTCSVNGKEAEDIPGLMYIQSSDDLIVYPNPASNSFTLKGDIADDELRLVVVDINGKEVYRDNNHVPGLSVDCSKWAPGIYLISVSSDSGVDAASKLVID